MKLESFMELKIILQMNDLLYEFSILSDYKIVERLFRENVVFALLSENISRRKFKLDICSCFKSKKI